VQIIAAARVVYPTPATGAPLPEEKMVPLVSPRSLSKTTSKPMAADIHPAKATQAPNVASPEDTSYCRYLGSLVTKLHREVALPQLIVDCGKAIVENAANQTGWNYMMISIAANWALNGLPNTLKQLAFIGLQLCVIPLFLIVSRMFVVLTPKKHKAIEGLTPGPGNLAPQQYVDKMLKNVPNKQDADKWLSEIHLSRDHPIVQKDVRNHDAYAFDEMWWLDKKGSYVPTILFWSLVFLFAHTQKIAKQNLLYLAFLADHLGTTDHAFVDTTISGIWHHVNTRDEIDSYGFCRIATFHIANAIALTFLATLMLYCSGIWVSAQGVSLAIFASAQGLMWQSTNHYFQHGRQKQKIPKLIRKYVFKGFLWKYNILLDDMFHKKHHFDDPEASFAILAGFSDKLIEMMKSSQTLYKHNPALNKLLFISYLASTQALVLLCSQVD
jgi:hypothetical protein